MGEKRGNTEINFWLFDFIIRADSFQEAKEKAENISNTEKVVIDQLGPEIPELPIFPGTSMHNRAEDLYKKCQLS